MPKPKVAFYWCASCGGCEEAVVDLAEDILKVVEKVDIVFWPVAMDFKRRDVEGLSDGELAAVFINGAIRTSEQEKMAKLLRRKSRLVVAFGSCAYLGGIPGLANLSSKDAVFETVYKKVPTVVNPEGVVPRTETDVDGFKLKLPDFYDGVRTLAQVIEVDYFLPGCAPPPDLIMEAINKILTGELPEKGSVLAPEKSLCDTCPRRDSKPDKIKISDISRIAYKKIDTDKCFLAEGIICLGPATRSGCGERCINANMPCRGCFGPTREVLDQGGKFLSGLMSIVDTQDEEEIKRIADSVIDPVGLFYMYSLPYSLRMKFLK